MKRFFNKRKNDNVISATKLEDRTAFVERDKNGKPIMSKVVHYKKDK